MPVIHEITDLTAPELDIYARLTQAQLRNRLEPEKGIFIAESPKVIARALDAGYQPLSLLMERKQITGPAQEILTRCGDVPVYTADRELLAQLTGFALTRGVRCTFRERNCPHSVLMHRRHTLSLRVKRTLRNSFPRIPDLFGLFFPIPCIFIRI